MTLEEIRSRMAERGYKQVDLANLLGLVPNKISKSFSGERRFTVGEMDQIRAWLGEPAEPAGEPVRSIPIIGQVAAGNWREAISSSHAVMPAPHPDVPKNAFALTINGDSMDLLAEDGGQVIVDPDDKALFPRRYYVVINGSGETTFKRFMADPARLAACSTNPIHTDIMIGGEETFLIVGRVIWRASRL